MLSFFRRIFGKKNVVSTTEKAFDDSRATKFQAMLDAKGIKHGDQVKIVSTEGHEAFVVFKGLEEHSGEEPMANFEDFRVEDEFSSFTHGFGTYLSNIAEIKRVAVHGSEC